MDFIVTITIKVTGVFSGTVINDLVLIAGLGQKVVDAVAIGIDFGSSFYQLLDDRPDG